MKISKIKSSNSSSSVFVAEISRNISSGTVFVCLASRLNFHGNGSLEAGPYFLYPSIQGTIWRDDTEAVTEAPFEAPTELFEVWPALSDSDRAEVLALLSLSSFYKPPVPDVLPPTDFDDEVWSLFEAASQQCSAILLGHQEPISQLLDSLKNDPLEIALDFRHYSLASASCSPLELSEKIRNTAKNGTNLDDFARWYSRLILNLNSKDSNIRLKDADEKDGYIAYARGMQKLGINSISLKTSLSNQKLLTYSDGRGSFFKLSLEASS